MFSPVGTEIVGAFGGFTFFVSPSSWRHRLQSEEMSLQKNTASQYWRVFAYNSVTDQPVTGDAANITAKISKDWGAAGATNDVNPTETEDGYYNFTLTQAETNADNLDIFPESSTIDVEVIGTPMSQSTVPVNFQELGIESDGDVTKVNTLADGSVTESVLAAIVTSGGAVTRVTNLSNAADNGDLTTTMKTSVQSKVADALDAAIPGSPTANSINERVKAVDDKLPSKDYLSGSADSDGGVDATELAALVTGVLTTQMTESYAADGVAPTLAQSQFAVQQMLQEMSISGLTMTVKKLDGSTTAMTFTLNANPPTSITRAS